MPCASIEQHSIIVIIIIMIATVSASLCDFMAKSTARGQDQKPDLILPQRAIGIGWDRACGIYVELSGQEDRPKV